MQQVDQGLMLVTYLSLESQPVILTAIGLQLQDHGKVQSTGPSTVLRGVNQVTVGN